MEFNLNTPKISIILPCLNEEASIGKCIQQIKQVIKENNLDAEIIIIDKLDSNC